MFCSRSWQFCISSLAFGIPKIRRKPCLQTEVDNLYFVFQQWLATGLLLLACNRSGQFLFVYFIFHRWLATGEDYLYFVFYQWLINRSWQFCILYFSGGLQQEWTDGEKRDATNIHKFTTRRSAFVVREIFWPWTWKHLNTTLKRRSVTVTLVHCCTIFHLRSGLWNRWSIQIPKGQYI